MIVENFFPRFAERMGLFASMPIQLIGVLEPPNSELGISGGPGLSWYFEPLASGADICRIEIGARSNLFADKYEDLISTYRRFRPDMLNWYSPTITSQVLDVVFDSAPLTEIVFSWLWHDLERIRWLKKGSRLPARSYY